MREHHDALQRFDDITNLWMAYHNGPGFPDEYGREFFHAAGRILSGTPARKQSLHYLDTADIEEVVRHAKVFERDVKTITAEKRKCT
jgi:hypothetical protein